MLRWKGRSGPGLPSQDRFTFLWGKYGCALTTRPSGAVQGELGRGLGERYPRLRSDLPVGNVTFELELEGHRLGQNEQCGQRGENEWRLRSSGSWVLWKRRVYLGRSQGLVGRGR